MYKPFNAVTGKPYNGKNVEKLTTAAKDLGTTEPRWLTFVQAKEKGYKIKKGAKGVKLFVFRHNTENGVTSILGDLIDADDAALMLSDKYGELNEKPHKGVIKKFYVFNLSQVEVSNAQEQED